MTRISTAVVGAGQEGSTGARVPADGARGDVELPPAQSTAAAIYVGSNPSTTVGVVGQGTSESSPILSDVVEEGQRIGDAAQRACVDVRLLGGVAIRIHSDREPPAPLFRTYRDIDLVSSRKHGSETARLLTSLGYTPNERFNALNSSTRLIFYDTTRGRQVDVFVGEFRMCHSLPIAGRLQLESHTLPLAELLLTKLQVFRLNEKDLKDIWWLLLEHDVGAHDTEVVNADFVARTLAGDWGLWRTSRQTVDSARRNLVESGLSSESQATIAGRLDRLWERIESEPKSLRWRSRARIGERMQWHEEPEEIAHAPLAGPEL